MRMCNRKKKKKRTERQHAYIHLMFFFISFFQKMLTWLPFRKVANN